MWCDANYYVSSIPLCYEEYIFVVETEETISLIEIYTWKPFYADFPLFFHIFSCFSSSYMYVQLYKTRMMLTMITRKDFLERFFCKAYHNNDDAKNHCVAQEFIKFNSANFFVCCDKKKMKENLFIQRSCTKPAFLVTKSLTNDAFLLITW